MPIKASPKRSALRQSIPPSGDCPSKCFCQHNALAVSKLVESIKVFLRTLSHGEPMRPWRELTAACQSPLPGRAGRRCAGSSGWADTVTQAPLTLLSLGLGTAGIGNLYQQVTDEQAEALPVTAWQAGIRYFDTAPFYGLGRAEARLGRFLANDSCPAVVSTKAGRVLVPVMIGDVPEVGFVDPLPFPPASTTVETASYAASETA